MKIVQICWLLVILLISFLPPKFIPSKYLNDFFVHSVVYYIFSLLIFFGIRSFYKKFENSLPQILKIALGVFIFSVAIEFLQMLTPFRSFQYKDIFANGVGVTSAYISYLLFLKIKPLTQK